MTRPIKTGFTGPTGLTRRPARSLAVLVSSMGLCLGAGAVAISPAANSAGPAGDCAEAFPLANVVKGQEVEGLTVDSGVTPEPFTGEVLGVLKSGIGAGLDMIIMKLDSPAIQAAGGIWQGMSGSPVYDATDNRLIGAVAYGLAYGSSPVAGITPFEDMDDYLASTGAAKPTTIQVGKGLAQRIARATDVSTAQAGKGLRQLPMSLGVSGVSAQSLAKATGRPYLAKNTHAVGKASGAAAPTAADIVAGGNIAASLAYGDVTAAGVGTATSVCNGRVVGFGHPFNFTGQATMSLHPADAIFVQEDPLGSPFKVANLGAPVGTITDDHLTGITGSYGALPDTMTVTSELTKGTRSRTGSTKVSVPMAAAEMTFYQQLANHDRVVDGVTGATELQTYTITGTDADGSPFSTSFTDRFTSPFDITFDASFDVPDLVFGISQLEGVKISDVTVKGTITDSTATYAVSSLQQRRNGTWVTVGKGAPAIVKAGSKLVLRSVLSGPSGTKTVPVSFTIPNRAKGQKGTVALVGGNNLFSEAAYQNSLSKILAGITKNVRNDEVQADLSFSDKGFQLSRSQVLGPVGLVVNGQRRVRVIVK